MGKKILLADDSITIQKVIELTFSDEDFEVVTVGNGRLAIEKVQEVRPDVVLCDIIMPEKDGYEVCEFIKKNPGLAHVPVLLLTGAFEPFDQERAARAGCDEIQKYVVTWPSWLFARGDVAAGGAGDESPIEFSDRTLNVKSPHRFIYVRGGGRFAAQPGPAKIYLNVVPVNPAMGEKPVVIWRNLTVAFRPIIRRTPVKAGESVVVTAEEQAAAAALRKGILPPGQRQRAWASGMETIVDRARAGQPTTVDDLRRALGLLLA